MSVNNWWAVTDRRESLTWCRPCGCSRPGRGSLPSWPAWCGRAGSARGWCRPRDLPGAARGEGLPHCCTSPAPGWCPGAGCGSQWRGCSWSWGGASPRPAVWFCTGLECPCLARCSGSCRRWCGRRECSPPAPPPGPGTPRRRWCCLPGGWPAGYRLVKVLSAWSAHLVFKKGTMEVNGVPWYRQHLNAAVTVDVMNSYFM